MICIPSDWAVYIPSSQAPPQFLYVEIRMSPDHSKEGQWMGYTLNERPMQQMLRFPRSQNANSNNVLTNLCHYKCPSKWVARVYVGLSVDTLWCIWVPAVLLLQTVHSEKGLKKKCNEMPFSFVCMGKGLHFVGILLPMAALTGAIFQALDLPFPSLSCFLSFQFIK